jgi:hypothetical protein
MPGKLVDFPEAELLVRIEAADRRGSTRGIVTERGITLFVALTFQTSPTFDDHPRIDDYFRLPRPDPDTKIAWLFESLTDHIRDQGRQPKLSDRITAAMSRTLSLIVGILLSPFVGTLVLAIPPVAAALGAALLGAVVILATIYVATLVVHDLVQVLHKIEESSDEKTSTEKEHCPEQEQQEQDADDLKQKAQELKARNGGKNRVEMPGKRVDLDGKSHGGVETPHVNDANPPHPLDSPGAGRDPGYQRMPRPATQQDLQDVDEFLKAQGK